MASNEEVPEQGRRGIFRRMFGPGASSRPAAAAADGDAASGQPRHSMGILNDKQTVEVPGSVLLLASSDRNGPLGLNNIPARTSHSSIPVGIATDNSAVAAVASAEPEEITKKMTNDGTIILEPQPDDSANDPLNWPSWRRDAALLSLGFYCMLGGGMTPVIAAGFSNISRDFGVSVENVALTTGIYMAGLGVGSILLSPTAILFGKRPVYLFGALLFIVTAVWCGYSPSYPSLLAARFFQGIAISPVECLPSATIAEIFFLHERAYRIGIYTLLLLGGKNLLPLYGAGVVGSYGWRWVFFILAMIAGLCVVLLFLFVPETFWDRTPTRKPGHHHHRPGFLRRLSSRHGAHHTQPPAAPVLDGVEQHEDISTAPRPERNNLHVGFATPSKPGESSDSEVASVEKVDAPHADELASAEKNDAPPAAPTNVDAEKGLAPTPHHVNIYTHSLRQKPAQSFIQQLRPFHGRLNKDNWFKVMIRPFILLSYPSVLWSSIVYACSIGWLIVISESLVIIYRSPDSYNFTALQTGLVYLSPFIGGVLGTGVAGKVSDIVVKAMSRRNGGLYEPEFRLVMVIPILITTCVGLMGFGWSVQERDAWIVPTVFFGIISFGCSLGSTTSITFCVDSYRQYAGEALVTLNVFKNIGHGLVFSFFFTHWLDKDGPKMVFIWVGVIQVIVCLLSIPMYIFGKRARMWTARRNLMERF